MSYFAAGPKLGRAMVRKRMRKRDMSKRVLLGLAVMLLVLGAIAVVRASTLTSRQVQVPKLDDAPVDSALVAKHMSELLRHATISSADDGSLPAVLALHETLKTNYPRTFEKLAPEVVAKGSLLFTWKGSDASLAPLLLLAHMDVVPVEPGTEKGWTHPAFDGTVEGGFVWGRGALDDKLSLLGIMEATEELLAHGFVPKRTLILAFGHDEEIAGKHGAVVMAELLASRGVHAELAVDEGGAITDGMIPQVPAKVAVIGLGEKGYATVTLSVEAPGGHSSTPAAHTSIGILASALAKLESHPMEPRIDGAMRQFASYTAPEMGFGPKVAFSNLWLTELVVIRALAGSTTTNATIRTTTAVTMFNGGVKDNVIPQSAKATVNFRILPGDSSASVLEHIRLSVSDERVKATVEASSLAEPSPLSSADSPGFTALARTIREVFPDTVVAPSLTLGATDGRHYVKVAKDVYRFLPVVLKPTDMTRVHGTDERVSVDAVRDAVRFYRRLIDTTCK